MAAVKIMPPPVASEPLTVVVTGHDGYIGACLVPMLRAAGHRVIGWDTSLFSCAEFGGPPPAPDEVRRLDVRDAVPDDLEGVDAVIHLAGISNDPLGDLDPRTTDEINHRATVHVAQQAKVAGVSRFLFASSCSLYGAHGDDPLDEHAAFHPVTPYGQSKVDAEVGLSALADDDFTPTYLRNATAYGVSHRLRGDLVVNNLTGFAVTMRQVFLKSDGTSWRPLVHVEDIARAFTVLASADRSLIHDEAFNVGASGENYRIRGVAEIVAEEVPEADVTLSDEAFNDLRNYRVNCDKLAAAVPDAVPQWTVRAGVRQLRDAMREQHLTIDDLEGSTYMRVRTIKDLVGSGRLGADLRWTDDA